MYSTYSNKRHIFEIFLQTLDDVQDTLGGRIRTGLTPDQVQTAFTEERVRDQYTAVMWSYNTCRGLQHWHDSGFEHRAWQEITGVLVDPWPRLPQSRPARQKDGHSGRGYGPSSNRSRRGPRRRRPAKLHADKGYDYDHLRK
ncbi:hypothetical protein [Streptomyces sp. NRRL S-1022]|uniref:hypothetical protein n=1 Tax=Streptomyces sp. NRRL S-1022 TaxID=1463880 RepID=UPI000A817A1F|nr:hypothetical protein [Streptomyces sp. NRRL S-1022]